MFLSNIYDDPATQAEECNIQLPSIQEKQTGHLDEHTESGGQHSLLLWQIISRICDAAGVHESQSFSQYLKDQNY